MYIAMDCCPSVRRRQDCPQLEQGLHKLSAIVARIWLACAGLPLGEARANPNYWDDETRSMWAAFVSGSKSGLVREEAWWDIADVDVRDEQVENNVDWNA